MQTSIHRTMADPALGIYTITEEDIYNALTDLDITKTTTYSPDHIPPIVLSKCASVLCQPLHRLFSLKYGYLPTDWKIHKVIPIFKSGDHTLVKNY